MNSKQQQWLLVGLVGFMVLVYAKALWPSKRPSPVEAVSSSVESASVESAADEIQVPSVSAAPVVDTSQREEQRERAAKFSWGRDPFAKGMAEGQAGGLALSGILWDTQSPLAIINGQMLHIGDEVDGYHVTEITPERVAISDGTDTFQLQVSP